jgi:4-diphosphocytidyl-2-C-methyl-D-erythritol kinase
MGLRVRALAKINLTLEVLNKRADGYHELRTVFQTISIGDTLEVEFTLARKTVIELESSVDIPDNLVVRAAEAVLAAIRVKAHVRFKLTKRIPMGGGLGGGSTDAAAVLMALPALANRSVPLERLMAIGAELGSDVPFFLVGGCALGLGRGTELYPLPDLPRAHGLLVTPPVHSSTVEGYKALHRTEEAPVRPNLTRKMLLAADWRARAMNDFEDVVFAQHPELKAIQRKLAQLGAKPALMTGSGAAVFGIFENRELVMKAREALGAYDSLPFSFVGGRQYRRMWGKQLG